MRAPDNFDKHTIQQSKAEHRVRRQVPQVDRRHH